METMLPLLRKQMTVLVVNLGMMREPRGQKVLFDIKADSNKKNRMTPPGISSDHNFYPDM